MTHHRTPAPHLRLSHVLLLLAALATTTLPSLSACAQAVAEASITAGCTLNHQVYTCDSASFGKALRAASTVSIETGRIDRIAHAQLESLAGELGKTVTQGTPGDLTFTLHPTDTSGVNVVSGEANVATLSVYSPAKDGAPPLLVWAEVYDARRDMPWPSVVNGVITQFKHRFQLK